MDFTQTIWNDNSYQAYIEYLKSLADDKYKEFNSKITPISNESQIYGVRVPKMRDTAKMIAKGSFRDFLDYVDALNNKSLSHEEISIYGMVIGYAKLPFGELCQRIRTYASKVNNWACCDCPVSSFKEIKKYIEEYKIEIYRFLKSENPWEQRVGLIILLDYYLCDKENTEYALNKVNSVKSDEYYVQMAQAWLIATAFAKQRDLTKDYLTNNFSLGDAVLKMTVRKLRDSYRVTKEDKDWAASLLKK